MVFLHIETWLKWFWYIYSMINDGEYEVYQSVIISSVGTMVNLGHATTSIKYQSDFESKKSPYTSPYV